MTAAWPPAPRPSQDGTYQPLSRDRCTSTRRSRRQPTTLRSPRHSLDFFVENDATIAETAQFIALNDEQKSHARLRAGRLPVRCGRGLIMSSTSSTIRRQARCCRRSRRVPAAAACRVMASGSSFVILLHGRPRRRSPPRWASSSRSSSRPSSSSTKSRSPTSSSERRGAPLFANPEFGVRAAGRRHAPDHRHRQHRRPAAGARLGDLPLGVRPRARPAAPSSRPWRSWPASPPSSTGSSPSHFMTPFLRWIIPGDAELPQHLQRPVGRPGHGRHDHSRRSPRCPRTRCPPSPTACGRAPSRWAATSARSRPASWSRPPSPASPPPSSSASRGPSARR